MGSFTGDMLRILAGGGMNLATNLIGHALTIPMETRSKAKLMSSESLLRNLPTMTQEDAAATAGILNKIAGTQVVPTRMAETGNVVGPTGEALAMTPMPGAPVSPEIKEQFVTGTPTLDQLKARAFGSMSLEEQKRHMKAIDTLGQLAAYENAVTAKKRYDAMYAPGGTEWRKVGVAESKVPIAQQQADASSLGAATGAGRLKMDTTKLEQVEIPAFESLKKYREDSIRLEESAQKAKTSKEKMDSAFELLKHGNDYLKTYNEMEVNARKRNLKKPADMDSYLADAEATRAKAIKLIAEGFKGLSPDEQAKYKDQVKQQMIPDLIENARRGHVPTQERLKALDIPWE